MAPNSQQARLGAHRSWARTADRTARTSAGTNAFLARFEREVDPEGRLTPDEREKRAKHARRAHMIELSMKGAATRRANAAARRKIASGGGDAEAARPVPSPGGVQVAS